MVAPYLVVLITTASVIKNLPRTLKDGGLPFILALIGVIYGLLVGLLYNQPISVIRGFLDWFTPIIFAFHLFINWRDYPSYGRNTQRVFVWAVLLIGAYGIYQFIFAPILTHDT